MTEATKIPNLLIGSRSPVRVFRAWACGCLGSWPIALAETRAAEIASRDCPACRAKKILAQREAEYEAKRAAWLAIPVEKRAEIEAQRTREYFERWGAE